MTGPSDLHAIMTLPCLPGVRGLWLSKDHLGGSR